MKTRNRQGLRRTLVVAVATIVAAMASDAMAGSGKRSRSRGQAARPARSVSRTPKVRSSARSVRRSSARAPAMRSRASSPTRTVKARRSSPAAPRRSPSTLRSSSRGVGGRAVSRRAAGTRPRSPAVRTPSSTSSRFDRTQRPRGGTIGSGRAVSGGSRSVARSPQTRQGATALLGRIGGRTPARSDRAAPGVGRRHGGADRRGSQATRGPSGIFARTPDARYTGLTIGGRGSGYGGYIRLGSGAAGRLAYGALYYDGGQRHRRGTVGYCRSPRYYHGYRPFYYYGSRDYAPWLGYTYASAYYPLPYVYRFDEPDVYYIENVYEVEGAPDVVDPISTRTWEGPPSRTESYPMLTEPNEVTPIGQGNGAFRAGRYDEARSHYISAVLADERDGYAKFLYALANFAVGEYDVAAMALRRALSTTPEMIEYPVDVRSLYPAESVFERQMDLLARFVTAHPQDRGARLLLGYLHYGGGEPERALSVLPGAAASDPDDEVTALLLDAVIRIVEGEKRGA